MTAADLFKEYNDVIIDSLDPLVIYLVQIHFCYYSPLVPFLNCPFVDIIYLCMSVINFPFSYLACSTSPQIFTRQEIRV